MREKSCKWYLDEVEIMEAAFTNDQMGELFFAVMGYVRDGKVRDVAPELKYAYASVLTRLERDGGR